MCEGYRVRRLPRRAETGGFFMKRSILALGMGLAALAWISRPCWAALSSQDSLPPLTAAALASDALEAHQYRLPEARIAGQESLRQQVTIWQVTAGTWNGETLKGLSLVLVKSTSDNGQSSSMTNCYISHLATVAQRQALLSAYLAAQSLSPGDIVSWRVEPAVIRFEMAGQTVVVHLGLVA